MTDETHQQVAAYALGALDDEEQAEFEAHLAVCSRCRDDAATFLDAAAALAFAAEGPAPPDALRGRTLEQARAERPNVVPLRRRREVPTRAVAALAVAAAAAAVAFGVWAATLSGTLDEERSAARAQEEALAVL